MKNLLIITVISFFSFSINAQKLGLEGKRFSAELNFSSDFYYPLLAAERLFEFPQYRTKLLFNYTVARKHSVGLIVTGSIYNLDSKFLDRRYRSSSDEKLVHFGVGIRHSIFVRDFISPVGSSFNYYIKRNILFHTNNGLSATSLAIGVGYESRVFISSKIPIYINYGFNSAFNFLVRVNSDSYNDYFKSGIYYSEGLEFNLGLGYIF